MSILLTFRPKILTSWVTCKVNKWVNTNCNFKSWETLKNEYLLDNKLYFQWIKLIHAIPLIWKQKINDSEKFFETNCCTRPSPNKKH